MSEAGDSAVAAAAVLLKCAVLETTINEQLDYSYLPYGLLS